MLPGRLSISRSFGDIESKDPAHGGKPGVIIAEPVIQVFDLNKDVDFFVLASDGIFDKLSNKEVVQTCWGGIEKAMQTDNPSLEQTLLAGA